MPTTLEEFVTAAEAVTSDQVSGCAFPALQSEESSFCFLPILWNYGGSLAQIDSPAGRQAFGFLKQLAENKALSEDNVNMTISDIAWEFANGNIAMAFLTSGYENEIREENPDLHFATTKLPCGENSITISGGEVSHSYLCGARKGSKRVCQIYGTARADRGISGQYGISGSPQGSFKKADPD